MRELNIIVVDDQAEVGEAVTRDLADIAHAEVFTADSAAEARAVINDLLDHDQTVALLLVDCVMPEESGVDLLRSLADQPQVQATRRVMVTGQATQQDTIAALNDGHLHRYVEKPWQAAALQQVVREELTRYVLAIGEDPLSYGTTLDPTLVRAAAARDIGQV